MVSIGIVGTGFVAHKRADAIAGDPRATLTAVVGGTGDETLTFATQYGAKPMDHWSSLVVASDVDLVLVSHINHGHGMVAEAALRAGKQVVVEYPLCLDLAQAERLIKLAHQRQLLLHVAHIELLAGNHLCLRAKLKDLDPVHYARYSTQSPKRTRMGHWTFHPALFGFPLVGALSRIHRLVDCFGPVAQVYCQNRYIKLVPDESESYHQGCLCTAQLTFSSGLIAEVLYGKGHAVWTTLRRLEVFGATGGLVFDGNRGQYWTEQGSYPISSGTREGLFGQDTIRVLDYLLDGRPLYCSVEASLYSLRVAVAAEQSAITGRSVTLP